MIYIISFILSIYVLYLYNKGKYSDALFGLLIISLACFEPNLDYIGFDGVKLRLIGENSSFISIILLLLFGNKRKQTTNNVGKTKIEKIVLILFTYTLVIAFITLFQGKESLFNVIALLKPYVFLLSVFIIKDFSKDDCVKALKKIVKLTVLVGVVAFIQVVFNFNIFGQTMLEYNDGVDRFWSPYPMAAFCCLYTLVMCPQRKYTFFFFLLLTILPLRRGLIISTLLTIAIYFYYEIRHNRYPKGVLVLVFGGLLAAPLLMNRFTSEGDNASNDIKTVTSGNVDYANFRNGGSGGSFLFRMAVLVERIDYLTNNRDKLLTGVGLIHEDTAQKQFNFFLGSYKMLGDERIPQQIDTTDIVWPPILMRLGLIGVVLYLWLFGSLLVLFLKHAKQSLWATLGAMFLFDFLVYSVADVQLVRNYSIFIYFIFYTIVIEEVNKRRVCILKDTRTSI